MAETIKGIHVPFRPMREMEGYAPPPQGTAPTGQSFNEVFERELNEVTFSKHAQKRLQSRDIRLNEEDFLSLQRAISFAQQKGAHDSLIFLRDLALIVSVKNNTVVTAIDHDSLRDYVFTNIDSAVIAT